MNIPLLILGSMTLLLSLWIASLVYPFLGSRDPSMMLARTAGPILAGGLAFLGIWLVVNSFKAPKE